MAEHIVDNETTTHKKYDFITEVAIGSAKTSANIGLVKH